MVLGNVSHPHCLRVARRVFTVVFTCIRYDWYLGKPRIVEFPKQTIHFVLGNIRIERCDVRHVYDCTCFSGKMFRGATLKYISCAQRRVDITASFFLMKQAAYYARPPYFRWHVYINCQEPVRGCVGGRGRTASPLEADAMTQCR